jgi:predicted kinase
MRSDPKLKDIDDDIRSSAIKQYMRQRKTWIENRIGVIIDSPSANLNYVRDNKKTLEENGYDVICIFIEVPLETALERNRNRERILPEDLVRSMWQECENNKDDLKKIFGNNLFIIPNGNGSKVQSRINKFLREPVKNPIGKEWIELELKLKNRL